MVGFTINNMYVEGLIPSSKSAFRCFLLLHVNCDAPVFLLCPELSVLAVLPMHLTIRSSSHIISRHISRLHKKLRYIKQLLTFNFNIHAEYIIYAGRKYKVLLEISSSESIVLVNGKIYIKIRILTEEYIKEKLMEWLKSRAYLHCNIKLSEAFYSINLFGTLDTRFINISIIESGIITIEYLKKDCMLIVNPLIVTLPLCFIDYFICYCLTASTIECPSKRFFEKLLALLPSKNMCKYAI